VRHESTTANRPDQARQRSPTVPNADSLLVEACRFLLLHHRPTGVDFLAGSYAG